MLKKYVLFGILVILVALGISALSIVDRSLGSRKAARSVPAGIISGFRTPPMSDFVPSTAVTGFQTPPYSDFVPANTVSGLSGYSRQNELRSLSPGPGLAAHKVLYSGH